MSFITSVIVGLALALAVLYLRSLRSWSARSRGRPLPPGPKGLPIVGNILDMPKARPWIGFRELCARHGNMVCLRVLNQTMVILGDESAISEFMDKRSANTSDRRMTQSVILTGQDWNWAFFEYGSEWRHHRRVFWQHFHPGAITKYRSVQRAGAHALLSKLLQHGSQDLQEFCHYSFSSSALKIAYGIDIKDEHDPTLAVVRDGVVGTREVLVSGGFLVDHLPFLRHLPAFVPGAGFQKKFAEWRKATLDVRDAPFKRYEEAADADGAPECVVTELIMNSEHEMDSKEGYFDPRRVAMSVGGNIFEAGSDTTLSTMLTFFLAMSLYPEVQKKAQAELDNIVGPDRLPDFSDRDKLVYLNALLKECARWLNVAPLGMSHTTLEDDEYKGYFIPAGTTLLANVWACLHDPNVYEDPDEFRPERFIRNGKLDPNVRDPYEFAFGFGRRICPGRYFADASLFINIASALHVFNITPPLDEDGKEIKVEPRMTDSFASAPEDCRCTIKPRGEWAEVLIYDAEQDLFSS